MCVRMLPIALVLAAVACSLSASACGAFEQRYEYEEEMYLRLDGSATVNVNASVASLVSLRGVDLPVDPNARVDRERVRALVTTTGTLPPRITFSRRQGRRFVHARLEVPDVRQLSRQPMFAWSTYQFDRGSDSVLYRQHVGAAAGASIDAVGWTGSELVVFKMHIPSEISYHNAPSRKTERGNILRWEQPLVARLNGEPIDVEVRMEPESILYSTLLLFGLTIVAAAMTFGIVIWWVARRGRESEELPIESG
jgi:hypothetical protein